MREQVEQADRVLLIFTEIYARRFLGKEVLGEGQGATFEDANRSSPAPPAPNEDLSRSETRYSYNA